jgi:hypothetical protein
MFAEATIVYFDPFYFKNGNTAKPKYFVVLKNIDNKNILASLPTRNDAIPAKDEVEEGCVELPQINLNCFVLSNQKEVTTCGKKLDFKTFIYGHQLDTYETSFLKEIYPLENTDYTIWGKMKPDIFKLLLTCLKTSKSVKQKYKKLLNA